MKFRANHFAVTSLTILTVDDFELVDSMLRFVSHLAKLLEVKVGVSKNLKGFF